ncbi:MAG: hypothetical protein C0391_03655 [Anaerolinea sp.]|nr:hypothetical protein [Anaerolinea sp.]
MKYPNPRKYRSIIGVIIISIVAVIPIFFFLYHLGNPVFIENAMGNWFATMIGVLIGILIAMEINRLQQENQEENERKVREKNEMEHKVKILRLLKKELEYNHSALLERQSEKDGELQREVFVNRLKDELWNAFSDGGELQWINDLQLLDVLSTAYYYIRIIIFLEEKYFDSVHYPGLRIQGKIVDNIRGYLVKSDPNALESITKALQEIDKSLA